MRSGLLASCIAATVVLVSAAGAQGPAPKDAPATLVITYELKSSGVERPASGERNVTWTVAHKFVATAKLKAEKPQGAPSLHQADPAQKAAIKDASKAAEKSAGDSSALMAQAEKIFEKCGDDEACIERETLKMAGSLDMDAAAAAGESAKAAGEAAKKAAPTGGRYQNFGRGTVSGTYTIDEIAHEAYFDAACSTKNEATCSIDTVARGAGPMTDGEGKTALPPTAGIEVDYEAGTAMIVLTGAGFGKAQQIVKSGSPDRASGEREIRRFSVPDGFGRKFLSGKCSAGCASASGTFTMETVEPLLRRPATLTVTWKFTRP